jgi:hypothetical protein
MTKQQFFDSLVWISGMPPVEVFENGGTWEQSLAGGSPPMAVKMNNGDLYILGNASLNFGECDCCSCYDRLDIVAYSYLYWGE